MTAQKRQNGSMRDKGFRLEVNKEIRMGSGYGAPLNLGPAIMEHFVAGAGAINSSNPQNFVTTETGAATPFAPTSASNGGAAIGVTGATTNNAEELAGKMVGWKASTMALERPLVLEVRAKFVGATTATDGDFYIGFADAVTYTNGLSHVISAASAYSTDATVEFAGFGYTSIATSGSFFLSGGNPLVGITRKNSGTQQTFASTVVKDSAYHTYRVEVSVNGDATLLLDGKFLASANGAVTAATALTPYIDAIAKNSHALTATVDYIYVSGGQAA